MFTYFYNMINKLSERFLVISTIGHPSGKSVFVHRSIADNITQGILSPMILGSQLNVRHGPLSQQLDWELYMDLSRTLPLGDWVAMIGLTMSPTN